MSLKDILQNFSFETLLSLPPSDLLALLAIALVVVFLVLVLAGAVALMFSGGIRPHSPQGARRDTSQPE